MTMMQANEKLYGLVDGAQYPDGLAAWVLAYSPEVRSLFEGLPEEESGNAAPILFEIKDIHDAWVREIDQMDRYRPCLTVMRSMLSIDELKTHLQRFLFADIGEGMQALLRFFDPRSLPSILEVCGKEMRARIMHPLAMWIYRGAHVEWQHVEIDERWQLGDTRHVRLFLNQEQLDELEQRDEPYRLMSEMDELGLLDKAQPYAARYQNFLRRYHRSVKWELASYADRYTFCMASYQYGETFDQQEAVHSAIRSSVANKLPLREQFKQVPAYVWQKLKDKEESSCE